MPFRIPRRSVSGSLKILDQTGVQSISPAVVVYAAFQKEREPFRALRFLQVGGFLTNEPPNSRLPRLLQIRQRRIALQFSNHPGLKHSDQQPRKAGL